MVSAHSPPLTSGHIAAEQSPLGCAQLIKNKKLCVYVSKAVISLQLLYFEVIGHKSNIGAGQCIQVVASRKTC